MFISITPFMSSRGRFSSMLPLPIYTDVRLHIPTTHHRPYIEFSDVLVEARQHSLPPIHCPPHVAASAGGYGTSLPPTGICSSPSRENPDGAVPLRCPLRCTLRRNVTGDAVPPSVCLLSLVSAKSRWGSVSYLLRGVRYHHHQRVSSLSFSLPRVGRKPASRQATFAVHADVCTCVCACCVFWTWVPIPMTP